MTPGAGSNAWWALGALGLAVACLLGSCRPRARDSESVSLHAMETDRLPVAIQEAFLAGDFGTAVAIAPSGPHAAWIRAQALFASGDIEGARRAAERAPKAVPGSDTEGLLLLLRCDAAYHGQDYLQAVALCREALTLRTDRLPTYELHYRILSAAWRSGLWDEAGHARDRLLSISGAEASAWRDRALRLDLSHPGAFYVRMGIFRKEESLRAALAGFAAASVRPEVHTFTSRDGPVSALDIGPFRDYPEARREADRIHTLGLAGDVVP